MTATASIGATRAPWGRIAYASLFVIALPVALFLWARRLDAILPLVPLTSRPLGLALSVAGLGLALHATAALWRAGGGMPASPYPPERLVTTGPYHVFSHPIYVGAVVLSLGVSLALGSAAGLWIVTPVLAASAAAWVLGFEGDLTRRRFGQVPAPIVSVAPDEDARPTTMQRATAVALVAVPWATLYVAVEMLNAPPDARSTYMAWERVVPTWPTAGAAHLVLVPFVLLVPVLAARGRDLRAFTRDSLWAMVLVFTLDLLVPYDARYHLAWAFIATSGWMTRWPRARAWILALAALAVAMCVVATLCGVADTAASGAVFLAVRYRHRLRRRLLDLAERIANSWREWTIGHVRLLSHGVYAGLGAGLGVGVAVACTGPAGLVWLVALTGAAIVGAGVWAQIVEGSTQLLRPYGYFGAVLAVLLVVGSARLAGADVWGITAAFCIGCTVTYAAGRLRCLVQGCCHGAPASPALGIVYRHPRTRVVRLSAWGGVPVHATPLYSGLWMLLVGAVLARLWSLGAPPPFIVGSYFILSGLGRFVEEHFRGEPQTLVFGGLRLYQWLSMGFVVLGASVTCLSGAPARAHGPGGFDLSVVPALILVSVGAYAAYGVDFPRSSRRFSRLV